MTDVTANISVGDEVEGVRFDEELIDLIAPGHTNMAIAHAFRDLVRLAVVQQYMIRTGSQSIEEAVQYADQHTTFLG